MPIAPTWTFLNKYHPNLHKEGYFTATLELMNTWMPPGVLTCLVGTTYRPLLPLVTFWLSPSSIAATSATKTLNVDYWEQVKSSEREYFGTWKFLCWRLQWIVSCGAPHHSFSASSFCFQLQLNLSVVLKDSSKLVIRLLCSWPLGTIMTGPVYLRVTKDTLSLTHVLGLGPVRNQNLPFKTGAMTAT